MSRMITENFSLDEFACKCGCGANHIHEGQVHRLQVVRDIIKDRIIITSGVRCHEHNDVIGGEINSYHLKGWAADWTVEDDKTLEWIAKTLLNNWSGGFHFYPRTISPDGTIREAFCHSDIGLRRRWV